MRKSVRFLIGLTGLLCTQHILHANTVRTMDFDPETLAGLRKIELSPVAVKRMKAAPATPLWLKRTGPPNANWPYEGPRDMAVTTEGAIYLLNGGAPCLVRVWVDTDTVEALSCRGEYVATLLPTLLWTREQHIRQLQVLHRP